jgi:PAS domain S-box-containing protein
VEDDQVDRMAFERHVLRQGLPFDLETAESGAEAIQKLQSRTFDVVLLDYMLGDMTGMELLPELRGLPAIFITGMGNEEIAVNAIHQGAYDYLVKDPQGSYLQMLPVVIHNVLERKGSEDSLRESRRTLTTLMSNLIGMVYRCKPDASLTMEFVSAGCLELTGCKPEELIAAPAYGRLILEEDRAPHWAAIRDAMAARKPYELSYRIHAKGGPLRWVWERGLPVVSGEDEVIALEGLISDITERKAAEEQLRRAKDEAEEATRLKNKFVSLVAHDLRVPLTTCALTLQLLRDDLAQALSTKQQEQFQTLLDRTSGVMRMIDDLLLVSRLQSGGMRPRRRFVGAAGVRATVQGLERVAEQKGIHFTCALPETLRLYVDADLVGEVLQNLVTNAIKFTHRGGTVRLFAPEAGGDTLAVQDTGIGIRENFLPHLFDADVITSSVGTAGEKGTGLGLPICRDIMRIHGGSVTVESKEGVGTTFCLRFPLTKPQVLGVGLADGERAVLGAVLAPLGADFRMAESEEDGLRQAQRDPPHLLILDPSRQGGELGLVTRLKREPSTMDIAVVVLTPVKLPPLTGRDAPDEVIVLPLDVDDLKQRLRRFLG